MDIALEACDTYFFDYVYAALLPAQPAPYNLANVISNSTQVVAKASSPWQYEPATEYFSFTPRDAAYQSQWTRDNTYRQLVSLFFITWWGCPKLMRNIPSNAL